jgi:hypothetical protein
MRRPRPQSPPTNQPRLLDQVRTTIRLRGKSYQTEKAYTDWIALHLFHNKCRPKKIVAGAIRDFLAHLVNDRNVAPYDRITH